MNNRQYHFQILSVLKAYAERSGYTVDTTTDGAEALYMAQKVAYDALLLDVMMPGKDGFEICPAICKPHCIKKEYYACP